LIEIQDGGFPITHEGPGGEQPLPGGFGIKKSAYRDEYHRQFFRQIDAALKPFLADDPLPLVVVGVDRFLASFNEVTNYKDSILATLPGSHDKTSPHELGKLVWPKVKEALAEQRQQVLSELDMAVGARKFVSTIGEVWRLANEGRGHLLLIEENFHLPARVDETGMHLIPAEDITAPNVMDDAVDEIIETVLSKQGRVVFLENGQLATHQRIALILRY
jgi:Bacterial archaeo-eukaryotic release factor family 3